MSSTTRDSLADWAQSLLRIIVCFLFLFHGSQKIFGMFGGMNGAGATAAVLSLRWFAGMIELVGGTLVLVGLFTRFAAFILSGEMAFAYFIVHIHRAFWPIQNNGESAVLFCFIFLFFAAAGAGSISLDHLWRGKSAGAS